MSFPFLDPYEEEESGLGGYLNFELPAIDEAAWFC
jgi:hypothetical protein